MPPVVPSTDSASHPESEPLNLDPDAPLSPSNDDDDMGYDEQFLKPESRPGDAAALWVACVSAAVSNWASVGVCGGDLDDRSNQQAYVTGPLFLPPDLTKPIDRNVHLRILSPFPSVCHLSDKLCFP
uniref:Pre-mRNA-splicing ATP-dependent RNA helicase PRP28 (EC) n=1 Tax=Ganoderma boninense TaxID=34458 RepID=A0A5K1K2K4_9APHY|nr:Pre-mRNA-splicing ATP-dependent RNA helicase PRP28 (EC [Ganoderma boninense]